MMQSQIQTWGDTKSNPGHEGVKLRPFMCGWRCGDDGGSRVLSYVGSHINKVDECHLNVTWPKKGLVQFGPIPQYPEH